MTSVRPIPVDELIFANVEELLEALERRCVRRLATAAHPAHHEDMLVTAEQLGIIRDVLRDALEEGARQAGTPPYLVLPTRKAKREDAWT